MTVVDPTPEALREVYEMRVLLEPTSVQKAVPHFTDRDLVDAEELLRTMESESDMGVWSSLNRDFHVMLVSASRSPRLARVVFDLLGLSALQIRRSLDASTSHRRRTTADAEHRAILDAIKSRDRREVRRQVEQHLRASRAVYVAASWRLHGLGREGPILPRVRDGNGRFDDETTDLEVADPPRGD
ncbi:MAG: GntR family transcriptional regulator [Candidatus Dormibacteria bacterium]